MENPPFVNWVSCWKREISIAMSDYRSIMLLVPVVWDSNRDTPKSQSLSKGILGIPNWLRHLVYVVAIQWTNIPLVFQARSTVELLLGAWSFQHMYSWKTYNLAMVPTWLPEAEKCSCTNCWSKQSKSTDKIVRPNYQVHQTEPKFSQTSPEKISPKMWRKRRKSHRSWSFHHFSEAYCNFGGGTHTWFLHGNFLGSWNVTPFFEVTWKRTRGQSQVVAT